MNRLTSILTVLLLSAMSSCVTEGGTVEPTQRSEGPWMEASPTLRIQIEDYVERLPWTHGMERIEVIHWFATVGEPAYSMLLELAADPRPDVAGAALASLGSTGDARLVEPIRAITWSYRLPHSVQLERARALVRLGDWTEVPTLIEGLEDEVLFTRALCSRTLYELTRETFGYNPQETKLERLQAVELWWAWWENRNLDPILAQPVEPRDG